MKGRWLALTWLCAALMCGEVASWGVFSRSSIPTQGSNEVAVPPLGWPLDVAWDGINTRRLLVNGAGALVTAGGSGGAVFGPDANGAPPTNPPVFVGGWDGVNIRSLLTDATGRLMTAGPTGASSNQVQGTAADGAAAVGNPVQTGGVDGSGNAQALLVDTSGRTQVVGAAASGAAVSGNPVYVGGRDDSGLMSALRVLPINVDAVSAINAASCQSFNYGLNSGGSWDRIRTANGASNTTGTGLLGAGMLGFDGTNYQLVKVETAANPNLRAGIWDGSSHAAVTSFSDGASAAIGAVWANSQTGQFNGATWDRQRGNTDVSLTTQTGATTTFTSADLTNFNGGHIVVVLDMTVIGTGSVTLEIDNKDVISGKYYSILTGAAVTTNSTNAYSAGPALPATANVSANAILSRTFRIKVTANNANATTYTVGYSLACN